MRLIKLAIASVNTTVGAVRSNVDRCIEVAQEMAADDVTLGAFPEQVIGGYAPEDLVQWDGFVRGQRSQLERFAEETSELATVFALGLIVGVGGTSSTRRRSYTVDASCASRPKRSCRRTTSSTKAGRCLAGSPT